MKNTNTQKKVELKEYNFLITFDCEVYARILAENEEQAHALAWEMRIGDSEIYDEDILISKVEELE